MVRHPSRGPRARERIGRAALAASLLGAALLVGSRAEAGADDHGIYATPPGVPTAEQLEKRGAKISQITVHVENVFDPYNPKETGWFYRTADSLHKRTREQTVRAQLLFQSGDTVSADRLAETERLLRNRVYLVDAWVVPVRYDPNSNVAEISVTVRDVWTLSPDFSFGRAGGKNGTSYDLQEENLAGTGVAIEAKRSHNVDRISTVYSLSTMNVFNTWWKTSLAYQNNSDGRVKLYDLERPFYSLDTRNAYGISGMTGTSIVSLYDLGEIVQQFERKQDQFTVYYGHSSGLIDGWTRRWYAGLRYDEEIFLPDPASLLPAGPLPPARRLSSPYVAFEIDEDRYDKAINENQIGRTEDLYFGRTLYAELGFADRATGSDRTAVLPRFTAGDGWKFPHSQQLFVGLGGSGRYEDGRLDNGLLNGSARYYWIQNSHALFYAAFTGIAGKNLDRDSQVLLGGDTGLRGYPLRYQAGSSDVLFTVEERLYSNWYPFRLVRVGGAVFADSGRVWGRGPENQAPLGRLSDAGVGLRVGNSRSGLGNVLHVDFSWALNSVPNARHFQITVQTLVSY